MTTRGTRRSTSRRGACCLCVTPRRSRLFSTRFASPHACPRSCTHWTLPATVVGIKQRTRRGPSTGRDRRPSQGLLRQDRAERRRAPVRGCREPLNRPLWCRGDGAISFDGGVRAVSGARPSVFQPSAAGTVIGVMDRDARAILEEIGARVGTVVEDVGAHLPEVTALVRDPAGCDSGRHEQRR